MLVNSFVEREGKAAGSTTVCSLVAFEQDRINDAQFPRGDPDGLVPRPAAGFHRVVSGHSGTRAQPLVHQIVLIVRFVDVRQPLADRNHGVPCAADEVSIGH